MPVQCPEAINWEKVLEGFEPPQWLPENPRQDVLRQGRIIHRWLQNCFESASLEFERELEWQELEWKKGRFDAFDGFYIYEFKSVLSVPEQPRGSDVEQVTEYVRGVDGVAGFVVYISRRDWTVEQFVID
jgi:hypothetical protein